MVYSPLYFSGEIKKATFRMLSPAVLFEQKEAFFSPLRFLNQNQQNFTGAFLSRLIGDFWNASHMYAMLRKHFRNRLITLKLKFRKHKCHYSVPPQKNVQKHDYFALYFLFSLDFVTYSLQIAF